jgi:spore coat polysaccharide biosynthesis protein SpsF
MYKTEQEEFWAGEFGNQYINRNNSNEIVAGNTRLFAEILTSTSNVNSFLEFGSNIGLNLRAIRNLKPTSEISAIEINKEAVGGLSDIRDIKVYNQSILDFNTDYQRDFVFSKGVLIHIDPESLDIVYQKLYDSSKQYVCIVEYYNPSPVTINYRGHSNKLFKRDFAGDMLDKFNNLKLVNYGFKYRRDNNFPMDDLTWFLLEKF